MRNWATVSTEEWSSKPNTESTDDSYYTGMEGVGSSRDELDGWGESSIIQSLIADMRKSLAKDIVHARDLSIADVRTIDMYEVMGVTSSSAPMLYGNDAFIRCAPPGETLQFVIPPAMGRFDPIVNSSIAVLGIELAWIDRDCHDRAWQPRWIPVML